MKKTKILKLLILAVILYGGWRGARFFMERRDANETIDIEKSGPPEVTVTIIREDSLFSGVWVTGEVIARRNVEIASKIAGRLERLRLPDGATIEEGVEIEAGQVVAVIEHEPLAAAARTAEAALEVAKAAYGAAQVNAADAQREKKRWIELRKEGVGTRQQLDNAITAHERAQAQLKQAEAQIVQAEAALAQARVNLDDAVIRAPFSGLVVRKHLHEGAFVGPSVPLFRLADIEHVEIVGSIAGRHFPKIRIGETRAVVEVDAYPGETFEGDVIRVRPELDRVTRTISVTISVPNPERKLTPGMYARMRLLLEERRNVPVAPDAAFFETEHETLAYVVRDGVIHVREVELGLKEGDMNEIIKGLRSGESVVVRGHRLLTEGMTVRPVEAEDIR